MKGITVLLTSIVLASFVGFGLAKSQETPLALSDQNANAWSAEEHQIAADLFEETGREVHTKTLSGSERVQTTRVEKAYRSAPCGNFGAS